MADLPLCRVTSSNAAFYFTGIDFFGPIMVKQNRSQVKRYGCVFTCLTMRTEHLEMGFSLETDAFVNVLRRFINRRGKPHVLQRQRHEYSGRIQGAATVPARAKPECHRRATEATANPVEL